MHVGTKKSFNMHFASVDFPVPFLPITDKKSPLTSENDKLFKTILSS